MTVTTTYDSSEALEEGFSSFTNVAYQIYLSQLHAGARPSPDLYAESYTQAFNMVAVDKQAHAEYIASRIDVLPEFKIIKSSEVGKAQIKVAEDDGVVTKYLDEVYPEFEGMVFHVYNNIRDNTWWGKLERGESFMTLGPSLSESSLLEKLEDLIRDMVGAPHRLDNQFAGTFDENQYE